MHEREECNWFLRLTHYNSTYTYYWIGEVVYTLAQGNVMSWANVLLGFQPVVISINIRIVHC